jgi:hypothetical protein
MSHGVLTWLGVLTLDGVYGGVVPTISKRWFRSPR